MQTKSSRTLTPQERLHILREELAQIKTSAYPDELLTLIKNWIEKATPTIKNDWPESINQFLNFANADWSFLDYVHSFKESDQVCRNVWESDNKEALKLKKRILSFLDGLLFFNPPNTDPELSQHKRTLEKPNTPKILLVTVTKIETQAVLDEFKRDIQRRTIKNKIYYDLGQIGELHVFMVQSEMGSDTLGGALLTVSSGVDALSPSAIIMVGIAFGLEQNKQQIGEILVAHQLSLYGMQKVSIEKVTGKPVFIQRGDRVHTSPRLLDKFKSGDLDWQGTKVHFGLVLSGEKLVDNFDYREALHQIEPEAIGGEMEGAGLYAAAENSKVDWILVKAICDWADGNKDQDMEQNQQLAAHNAAKFVLHVLQQFNWQDPQEKTTSGSNVYDELGKLLDEINTIKQLDYYHPKFQGWHKTVKLTLEKFFGKSSSYARDYAQISWHTSDRLEDKEEQNQLFTRSCIAAEGLLTAIVRTR